MILIIAVSPKPIFFIIAGVTWYFLVCVDLLDVGNRFLVVTGRVATAAVAGDLRCGGRHLS